MNRSRSPNFEVRVSRSQSRSHSLEVTTLRPSNLVQSLGLPSILPKAQLSTSISILMTAISDTLTATGMKPVPQHVPGKKALASSFPESLSRIVKVGDLPIGAQA